jgi:hypothetical protein
MTSGSPSAQCATGRHALSACAAAATSCSTIYKLHAGQLTAPDCGPLLAAIKAACEPKRTPCKANAGEPVVVGVYELSAAKGINCAHGLVQVRSGGGASVPQC